MVGSHKLAREIVSLGSESWHVSTPIRNKKEHRIDTELKIRRDKAGRVEKRDGVVTYIPQVSSMPHFYQLDRDRILTNKGLPKFDLVVVDQPTFLISAWKLKRITGAKIIYRPTDLYSRVDLKVLGSLLMRIADSIIVTNRKCIPERLYRNPRYNIVVRPNGLTSNSASLLKKGVKIEGIKKSKVSAVYVGAIDKRIDWNFICKLAASGHFEYIDLFGPSQFTKLNVDNVSLCGPVSPQDLERLLSSYDCALFPFKKSLSNSSRSPMKLAEYLTSGLKVITSPEFDIQEEFKPLEKAIFSFEDSTSKSDFQKFLVQDLTLILDDKAIDLISYRMTAQVLLDSSSN